MNRVIPLAATIALVAAAPAAAQSLPRHSFVKLEKVDVVDVGAPGDSVGDMTVFTFTVFDRVGGRRIGGGHGYCVRTEVGVANDCTANSSLPGGRIVMQWEEFDGQRVSRAAITGGTGRYRNARGELRLTSLSPSEVSAGG
jgi:allene oxide cyclase